MESLYYYRSTLLRFLLLLSLLLLVKVLRAQSTTYTPTYASPGSAITKQGCVQVGVFVGGIIGVELKTLGGTISNGNKLADSGTGSFDAYASLTPPLLPTSQLVGAPKTSIKAGICCW